MNYEKLSTEIDTTFFLIGGFILIIELLKAYFSQNLKRGSLLDMLASLSTQIPYLLVEIFIMSFVYYGFVVLSEELIPWTFTPSIGIALLTLLCADFVYYWEHRIAHEVRLFWTQHAVHHSSRYMNILVGVRFGPFETVISAILHTPLLLIGFPAELVFFSIITVLAYQTWIHTELVGSLGIFDVIFNTPANHRVHHGCDEKYIDKNYGGILILWDRLFGTYQCEEERPRYGLKRNYNSVNPFSVWFSEIPALFQDISKSRSPGEKFKRLFAAPDWQPEKWGRSESYQGR
ncbi:MAG: sterol desaturase family protein [Gammaproteobacteria bacterium]|nr:sterol desaturase family protein [Gammaproteobacteria bacterium]